MLVKQELAQIPLWGWAARQWGVIPVDREEVGSPDVYGKDRLFVYIRLEGAADAKQEAKVEALEKAGLSVVRIRVLDKYDIGQEFFRWEIATAVAGSVIGINCFNQPDVEASKIETRTLTQKYEETGSLPPESPILEDQGVKLFADEKHAGKLTIAAGKEKTLTAYLRAHLNTLGEGDYAALLAYVQMNEEHEEALQSIRHAIRDKKHVATCLGFGPRFLQVRCHSSRPFWRGASAVRRNTETADPPPFGRGMTVFRREMTVFSRGMTLFKSH